MQLPYLNASPKKTEAKEAWDRWIKEEGGSVVPWMQVFHVVSRYQ